MAKEISNVPRVTPGPGTSANLFTTKRGAFAWLALLLVALAILRSAITTRLDGFTIDEAYHIAAGVSYVKYHDFRINPEHPPLVKLWVALPFMQQDFDLIHFANSTTSRGNGPLRILPSSDKTILTLSSGAHEWQCTG